MNFLQHPSSYISWIFINLEFFRVLLLLFFGVFLNSLSSLKGGKSSWWYFAVYEFMHVPYSFSYNIDKIAKLELACQHNYIICQPYFGNKTNFMVTNLTAMPFLSVKNCFYPIVRKNINITYSLRTMRIQGKQQWI